MPIPGTPPTQNIDLPPAAPRLDIDYNPENPLIDRALRAKMTASTNREDVARIRSAIYGYNLKMAETVGGRKNVHPPDPTILAQILAIASPAQVEWLRDRLFEGRIVPGENYSWWLTLLLQRLHNISPQTIKKRRAELRLIHGQRTTPPDPQPDPQQPEPQPEPQPDAHFAKALLSTITTRKL